MRVFSIQKGFVQNEPMMPAPAVITVTSKLEKFYLPPLNCDMRFLK